MKKLLIFLALAIVILGLCGCKDYSGHKFDGLTDVKFGMTKELVIQLDDATYSTNKTYRTYRGEGYERIEFESGARKFTFNENGALTKIEMQTENQDFLTTATDSCGEYDSQKNNAYIWNGTLYGTNAVMTVEKLPSGYTVTIEESK